MDKPDNLALNAAKIGAANDKRKRFLYPCVLQDTFSFAALSSYDAPQLAARYFTHPCP